MHVSRSVKVNGPDADPLFAFLQTQKGFGGFNPDHKLTPVLEKMLGGLIPTMQKKADIKWSFTKFLVNKKGQVVARFEPTESFEVIAKAIEEELAK